IGGMRTSQPVRKVICEHVHHDALLFQLVDSSFYLRILRLDRQGHKNFINHIGGDELLQISDITEPRHTFHPMSVEVCFIVDVADDAVSEIVAPVYFINKPAGARAAANDQKSFKVVSAQ